MKISRYKYLIVILFLLAIPIESKAISMEEDDRQNMVTRGIKEVYATSVPQKLREVLNYYSKLDPKKEEDKKEIEEAGANNDLPLFRDKFVAYYLQRLENGKLCSTSGYDIGIYISPDKMQQKTITICETSNGKYVIHYIMDFGQYERRKDGYLYWWKYQKYWL